MLLALFPAVGGADAPDQEATLPTYDGIMSFPPIRSSAEPEELFWEVKLAEGQELRQIDEHEAAVYYASEDRLAMDFFAIPAHDVVGTRVPTTLAFVNANVMTLIVHHREGNPASGGAPFTYPVLAGEGWEGGFQTNFAQMPPSESAPRPPEPELAPTPTCEVPNLHGATLDGARKLLRRARCRLGAIAKAPDATVVTGRVVRQTIVAGKSLLAGAKVGVRLGPPALQHG